MGKCISIVLEQLPVATHASTPNNGKLNLISIPNRTLKARQTFLRKNFSYPADIIRSMLHFHFEFIKAIKNNQKIIQL